VSEPRRVSRHRATASELGGNTHPWLSAIPRSCKEEDSYQDSYKSVRKRTAGEVDEDYDGDSSSSGSDNSKDNDGYGGIEKNAAQQLMKLSMSDGLWSNSALSQVSKLTTVVDKIVRSEENQGPRVKRRRATSV
jgi:hypothetical protein